MASLPERFASDLNPIDPALVDGVLALEQGDYLSALAYFGAVQDQSPGNELARSYAQMGLVVTYERYGQPDQAIGLCQTLTQAPQIPIKTWAAQTLLSFAKQYPHLVPPEVVAALNVTGFVPLDAPLPGRGREFVPLPTVTMATPLRPVPPPPPASVSRKPKSGTQLPNPETLLQPSEDWAGSLSPDNASSPAPSNLRTNLGDSTPSMVPPSQLPTNLPGGTVPRSQLPTNLPPAQSQSQVQNSSLSQLPTQPPSPAAGPSASSVRSQRAELRGGVEAPTLPPILTPNILWRQADRVQRGKPLSQPRVLGFRLVTVATALGFLWGTVALADWLIDGLAEVVNRLPFLYSPVLSPGLLDAKHTAAILITLGLVLLPWGWELVAPQARKRAPLTSLQIMTAGGVILLFFIAVNIANALLVSLTNLLALVPWFRIIPIFPWDQPRFIALTFLALFAVSPWLLDLLLQHFYGLQPLSMPTLANYSPEATRILGQVARQQKIPIPALRVLPIAAPLTLTYGCLPRFARIVVSQGTLDQLSDDEIATLYAGELGHLIHWDFAVLSLWTVVSQIPYLLYWKLALWGDRVQKAGDRSQGNPLAYFPLRLGLYLLTTLSIFSYWIYWLLRLPILWLSRWRTWHSDRIAVEVTGNPNGLTRALLKVALGIAADIQQQEQTSPLLESFEPLTPLGYRLAITVGSLYPELPADPVWVWDITNPHRWWLNLMNAHPLVGERLYKLAHYARYWNLPPELDWGAIALPNRPPLLTSLIDSPQTTLKQWAKIITSVGGLPPYLQQMAYQIAPVFGIFLGMALGWALRAVTWLLDLIGLRSVGWLATDPNVFHACILFGITIATFLWTNPFFPEIKTATQVLGKPSRGAFDSVAQVQNEFSLLTLLSDPQGMLSDAQPVYIQGQLLGRPGLSNVLGQDLFLKTSTGVIRLHHIFQFGPLLEIWLQSTYGAELVGKPVTVTGWFRRGATPWIDLETIRHQGGRTTHSGHPVWLTALACIVALEGIRLIMATGR